MKDHPENILFSWLWNVVPFLFSRDSFTFKFSEVFSLVLYFLVRKRIHSTEIMSDKNKFVCLFLIHRVGLFYWIYCLGIDYLYQKHPKGIINHSINSYILPYVVFQTTSLFSSIEEKFIYALYYSNH